MLPSELAEDRTGNRTSPCSRRCAQHRDHASARRSGLTHARAVRPPLSSVSCLSDGDGGASDRTQRESACSREHDYRRRGTVSAFATRRTIAPQRTRASNARIARTPSVVALRPVVTKPSRSTRPAVTASMQVTSTRSARATAAAALSLLTRRSHEVRVEVPTASRCSRTEAATPLEREAARRPRSLLFLVRPAPRDCLGDFPCLRSGLATAAADDRIRPKLRVPHPRKLSHVTRRRKHQADCSCASAGD